MRVCWRLVVLWWLVGAALGGDEGWEVRGIGSLDEWAVRRAGIVAGFEAVAGKLPSREGLEPPVVVVREEAFCEGYRRKLVTVDGEVTAYLYVPEGMEAGERRAAVVALHPTHAIGKAVVDGQSERPNRGYGQELAALGYVVIAPDYVSFGERAGYDFAADGFDSGTMRGIWDHVRCVDVLVGMAEVDAGRIGVIGHSLGGHNAIFLGVFDERVRVVVSSCGWTPLRDYYGGKLDGWTSDRYLPRIATVYGGEAGRVPFDFYGLVAALAPRAFFSNSPVGDGNFDVRGGEKAEPLVKAIYGLHGVPGRLRMSYPECGHDFPVEVRFEAYRFLGRELGR